MFLIEGTVVAKDSSGYPYVTDAAGYTLYIRNDKAKDLKVGTSVKLAGTGTVYNGFPQFGANQFIIVEEGTEVATVNHGTPVTVSGAEFVESVFTNKDSKLAGKYVEITGVTVVKSGSYYNVGFGETQIQASVNKTAAADVAAIIAAANEGKEVTVRGYSNGCNSSVARIAIVDAELGNHPTGRVLPFFSGEFNKAFPTGWEAVGGSAAWYSDGGLKLNGTNKGLKTSAFTASNKIEVELMIRALNAKNSYTAAEGPIFTVNGYNAAGEKVATANINSVTTLGSVYVVLEGTGIVSLEVIMVNFPEDGTKTYNCSLGGVAVRNAQ
jgi:hypothetical protein